MSKSTNCEHPTSNRKLLVRPRRMSGESLRGYIWRVFEQNGIPEPAKIYSNFRMKIRGHDASIINSILALDGIDSHEIPTPLGSESKFEVSNADLFEIRNALNSRKICVQCLDAYGYHRKNWEYPWFVACPEHGIWMIDKCQGCGKPITWDSSELTRCSCDFNFLNSNFSEIDRPTIDLYRKLLQSDYPDSGSEILDLDVDAATVQTKYLNAIQILGGEPIDPASPNKLLAQFKPLEAQRELLNIAGKNHINWQNNLFETLKRTFGITIYHHWQGIAVEVTPLNWNRLNHYIQAIILPNFIVVAAHEFIESIKNPASWSDFYSYSPNYDDRWPQNLSVFYYCSNFEVMELLNIQRPEFDFLVSTRLLPAKSGFRPNRLDQYVPRYIVNDAIQFYDSTINFSDAACQLGIPIPALHSLIKYHVIDVALDATPNVYSRIRKTAILELIKELETLVGLFQYSENEIGYSLSDWRRLIKTRNPYAEFGLAIKLILFHQVTFSPGCSKVEIFQRLIINRATWLQLLKLFPFFDKRCYSEQIRYSRLACSCVNGKFDCWHDIDFAFADQVTRESFQNHCDMRNINSINAKHGNIKKMRSTPFKPIDEC